MGWREDEMVESADEKTGKVEPHISAYSYGI